jgi:hypothetical protein
MDLKLTWHKLNRYPRGRWLQAFWPDFTDIEPTLNEIQRWCKDNNCGTRMSYDMWRFKTRAEVTAFLLRWS